MRKYLIVIDRKQNIDDVKKYFEEKSIEIVKEHKHLDFTFEVKGKAADINKVPGLLAKESPTVKVEMFTTEVPWHKARLVTKMLPLRDTYDAKYTGQGATVYVMDSGIDKSHPELVDADISDLFSVAAGKFDDEKGHGTAMTSLIAGKTVGVAPGAKIKNVKITDPSHSTTLADLLDAFDAILSDHLATADQAKVVNMSWNIAKNDLLDLKVIELLNKNLVMVAAAGNDDRPVNEFSPAGINDIITVAASDEYDRGVAYNNNASAISAGTSGPNYGAEIDMFAPGVDVPVAALDGTVSPASGTSVSAAIISAVAAMFIEKDPTKHALYIKSEIVSYGLQDVLYLPADMAEAGTNNVLAHVPNRYYGEVWFTSSGRIANFKKNSGTHEVVLSVSDTVTEVIVPDNSALPSYVTLTDKTLSVNTDAIDYDEESFVLQFVLTAKAGENQYPRSFSFGFYTTDESELDASTVNEVYLDTTTPEEAKYIVIDENPYSTKPGGGNVSLPSSFTLSVDVTSDVGAPQGGLEFRSDGTIWKITSLAPASQVGTWVQNATALNASLFEVKLDASPDQNFTAGSAARGVFHNLGTNRLFVTQDLTQNDLIFTVNVTITVREIADPTGNVATQTATWTLDWSTSGPGGL